MAYLTIICNQTANLIQSEAVVNSFGCKNGEKSVTLH